MRGGHENALPPHHGHGHGTDLVGGQQQQGVGGLDVLQGKCGCAGAQHGVLVGGPLDHHAAPWRRRRDCEVSRPRVWRCGHARRARRRCVELVLGPVSSAPLRRRARTTHPPPLISASRDSSTSRSRRSPRSPPAAYCSRRGWPLLRRSAIRGSPRFVCWPVLPAPMKQRGRSDHRKKSGNSGSPSNGFGLGDVCYSNLH